MLKILGKALKIFLLLLLIAALAVGAWYLNKVMNWPWWAGGSILLGVFALIVGGLFLKKYFFRRREKKFVERIVEHDEAFRKKAPAEKRAEIRSLEERWKEAIAILKRSHLRKRGNPIYVLPWFLVIGEPGSGKTTAIHRARLHAPKTEVSGPPQIRPTGNVDWWFFDQGVVLDTAGRYVVHQNEALDKEEWQKFLYLLSRSRKREPLNGLVVAMGADRVLNADQEDLAETARSLRRGIDELMRVMGAKFPVFILITKTDQVLGFNDYGQALPEEVVGQALGLANTGLRLERRTMVDQTIQQLGERLKDIRLSAMDQGDKEDAGLFIFPEELTHLEDRLHQFVGVLFERNPYQETPILRGIYFASGEQVGKAKSGVITETSVFQHYEEPLPDTKKGLFLTDFFAKVLPSDRNIFTHLLEFISWRRLTESLGLLAWFLLALFFCGLLTLSFYQNQKAIDSILDEFQKPPALTGKLSHDLVTLQRFRQEIIEMNQVNKDWWIPRLGLDQSRWMERQLENQYNKMFKESFLKPLDKTIIAKIGAFNSATPNDVIGSFISHMSSRINLLNARIKGASAKTLEKMTPPSYWALTMVDNRMIPQIAAEFAPLYLSYLEWSQDLDGLQRERSMLTTWLTHLATAYGSDLNWLIDYANAQGELPPVKLSDFWGAGHLIDVSKEPAPKAPAAFTLKGREMIEKTLEVYKKALPDPSIITRDVDDFNNEYWRKYMRAWSDFALTFDEGYLLMRTEHDRRTMAENMADPGNPYFRLLEEMAEQLKPLEKTPNTPPWVQAVHRFENLRQQAAHQSVLKAGGTLAKVAEEGKSLVEKGKTKAGSKIPDSDVDDVESALKAVDQLEAYEKALNQIIPVTTSPQMAFKIAQELFPGGKQGAAGTAGGGAQGQGGGSGSPLQDANTALTKLRTYLLPQGAGPNNPFWKTLTGPLDFIVAYTIHEAACELQYKWEGDVIAATQEVPEAKLQDALFDSKDGVVWKFVKGPAADFLGRGKDGYYARKIMGKAFPFTQPFLMFLDQGASSMQIVMDEYDVTLTARPTDVNKEALLDPYATVLLLNCSDKPQQLENFNYPSQKTFKWSPGKCGTVTLDIVFNDFTATKQYTGVNGFPSFLKEFRAGAHSFKPSDFPDAADMLNKLKINDIRVIYEIQGGAPLVKLQQKQVDSPPVRITDCWSEEDEHSDLVPQPAAVTHDAQATTTTTQTAPAQTTTTTTTVKPPPAQQGATDHPQNKKQGQSQP